MLFGAHLVHGCEQLRVSLSERSRIRHLHLADADAVAGEVKGFEVGLDQITRRACGDVSTRSHEFGTKLAHIHACERGQLRRHAAVFVGGRGRGEHEGVGQYRRQQRSGDGRRRLDVVQEKLLRDECGGRADRLAVKGDRTRDLQVADAVVLPHFQHVAMADVVESLSDLVVIHEDEPLSRGARQQIWLR